MFNFQKEKILIIGLGITGISCVKFFCRRKIIPRVIDTRMFPPGLKQLPKNVPFCFGKINKQWLKESTLIILSPGLSFSIKKEIRDIALNKNIISDIDLFFYEAKAPILAITGTNGKSTVTNMVGEMANCAGWKVGMGGNNGIPALEILNSEIQLYVLELSNFQLEDINYLRTVSSVVLNISEDHINYYPMGYLQYKSIKLKIYDFSSLCIVNIKNIHTIKRLKNSKTIISFGHKNSDYCIKKYYDQTWLVIYGEKILNCKDMNISGDHNYINALAALALADSVNIPRSSSINALKKFCGLPHRLEIVNNFNGIKWINDSKSTNIDSTIAAIRSCKSFKTIHLLLGGDGKSANFYKLLPYIKKRNIKIYCFGKDGLKLSKLISEKSIFSNNLTDLIKIIKKKVMPGDLVLLSPACSSHDQFSSFEERGELFSFFSKEVDYNP